MSIPYQRTLASNASLEGTSLHTGEKVTLTMKPAPPNHGIVFRRIDLEDMPFIPANVDNVQQVESHYFSSGICKGSHCRARH